MNDLKRFFSADVIIVGIVYFIALIVFIICGSYLPALLAITTILCAAIARGYQIEAEDSESVIARMSEKISELEVENVGLQKENDNLKTIRSSLEWYRDAEKINSGKTIAELQEEIKRLSAELKKAKAADAQDSGKIPRKKKKLDLSDEDAARIKAELRTAGLIKEEE